MTVIDFRPFTASKNQTVNDLLKKIEEKDIEFERARILAKKASRRAVTRRDQKISEIIEKSKKETEVAYKKVEALKKQLGKLTEAAKKVTEEAKKEIEALKQLLDDVIEAGNNENEEARKKAEALKKQLAEIRQVVECHICYLPFGWDVVPYIGVCGHSMFLRCVTTLPTNECPTCRFPNVYTTLEKNYTLVEVTELLEKNP